MAAGDRITKSFGFIQVDGTQTATAFGPMQQAGGLFPPNTPVIPSYALIQAEGRALRWRDDGIDPTPTQGMLIPPNETLVYNGPLRHLRIIGAQNGSIANITFYA